MFNLALNTISKKDGNGTWLQVLMGIQIPRDRTFSFKVKIVTTVNKNIMMGIVDK